MKPRLLDLFCGAGGAAMGYADAGFEVVGVDLSPQKNYPFEFHQGNALNAARYLTGFDAIHASPPCQAYSITKHTHKVEHPDLVGITRELLDDIGLPYVIENVVGAPMLPSALLCGTVFDLTATDTDGETLYLKRHRLFELSWKVGGWQCNCAVYRASGARVAGVYGGGSRDKKHAQYVRHGGYTPAKSIQEKLMGIDWMTQKELHQAIPPRYTQEIGQQLLQHLPPVGTQPKGN
jgi:DNA (cytosine-5)-methyltransferase 1